jgi:hypothetical protein
MTRKIIATDARTVTVQIQWRLKKRGGRKLVLAPDGSPVAPQGAPHIQNAAVKVLIRAFGWRKLLETGAYATLGELALAKGIDPSYLGRVLRLTLLAPDIIEAILDERLPEGVGVETLLKPLPRDWKNQLSLFGVTAPQVPHEREDWSTRLRKRNGQ